MAAIRFAVAVCRLLAGLARRWSLIVPLVLLACLTHWIHGLGWLPRLGLLVFVGGPLVAWWRLERSSFTRWIRLPVRAWRRRWFRYAPAWWFWMGRCNLALTDEFTGTVVKPRLARVRCTPSTDRLLVRLPAGFKPDDLITKAETLAEAMRVNRASIHETYPRRPGRVWLDLERRDPLVKTIPALPIPTTSASADRLDVDDLDGLVIGYGEDGAPWRLKIRGNHILVVGVTGAGKGSVIWSVLRALCPFIRAGLVVVHAIDPKGGMELEFGAGLFTRYERDGFEAMVELLEHDAADMEVRSRFLRGKTRKFTPSTTTPLVLIIIDELATLTELLPDRRLMIRADTALGLLLTKGRAPGYAVLACVQDPSKEIVRWRQLFPTKLALRLDEAIQVDMVLGDGVRERGAYADRIPEDLPGVLFVKVNGRKEPRRVRAGYCTDDDIITMARDYHPVSTTTVPAVLGEDRNEDQDETAATGATESVSEEVSS